MKHTWFGRLCMLVQRIPTMKLTVQFFWSLMYYGLTPEDRVKVTEGLMDYVTNPEVNVETEDYD